MIALSCRECEAGAPRTVRWPLALAIAMGAPALVLVSVGPVAALAGPASVLVWAVSAMIGLLMAVSFAELACLFPNRTGGVAVLAAEALRPRHPFLAVLGEWGYWLGWSPAMAIGAALVGAYVHERVAPASSPWLAWLLATTILALSAFVNHFGIRTCARVQLALAAGLLAPLALLAAWPLFAGRFELSRLSPFAPPGGWASWDGLAALAGALFLASWSAYAAEVTLTYSGEHREGTRGAVRSLFAGAGVMVIVYSLVPLALIGALGVGQMSIDSDRLLAVLSAQAGPAGSAAVVALALVALVLSLNMISVADSRVLCQMARNGDAWTFLERLNRHGAPRNALLFDVAVNAALLALALLINRGRVSAVPITLLTAASVGYLTSLVLALLAAWRMRREQPQAERPFRAPRGFGGLGLALAGFNAALLLGAGQAWGWKNVALGVVVLAAVVTLMSTRASGLAPVGARAALAGEWER